MTLRRRKGASVLDLEAEWGWGLYSVPGLILSVLHNLCVSQHSLVYDNRADTCEAGKLVMSPGVSELGSVESAHPTKWQPRALGPLR